MSLVKKIVLGVIFIIFAGFVFIYYITRDVPILEPDYVIRKIAFSKYHTQLYLKAKIWGISADHEIISVSANNEKNIDKKGLSEFIFIGQTVLFYKTTNDSLILYVDRRSPLPPLFKNRIKIVQVEKENSYMMNLFENDNYKKEHLDKFE